MIRYIIILVTLINFIFAEEETNSTKEYRLKIEVSKSLNKETIAKTIGVKDGNMLSFLDKEYIITEEFLKNLKPTLKGYLESSGYFDASFDIDISNNSVFLKIEEGRPVKVTDLIVDSDFKVEDIIFLKRGDIFSSDSFVNIKEKITTRLLESGYCKYKLETKAYVDLKQYSAKLDYKLKKGELCYFGDINITKQPKDIKKDVIISHLGYRSGDIFDIRKIKNSYTNLSSLNTFANIEIKSDMDSPSNKISTTISLDKKEKLRRYLIALGADTEVGLRVRGLWEKRNFLHNAKKLTIESYISKDIQNLTTTLFIPAFYDINKRYIDLYISGGYRLEKADAYREKMAYIDMHAKYRDSKFNVMYGIKLERLIIKLKKEYPSKIGGTFNILYPYIDIEYDNRDSKIDPKNGYFLRAYGEYGLSYRNNGVNYFKYLLEARAIKSFNDLTLSAVGKVGAIHILSGRLPASKLFYAGGLFSNRAYGKGKIGYITSNSSFSQLGGKSFINMQLEANYKIHKKFYGAIFFDSTLISEKEYNFHGNRVDTIGFGLRYKTPIGPIKLDVGFNIHKRKDYAISIMLGQSF